MGAPISAAVESRGEPHPVVIATYTTAIYLQYLLRLVLFGLTGAIVRDHLGLIAAMLVAVFILGMFLDWTGIVLLSFPIFLPLVAEMNVDPLWFVVLMAVVLQTSFLSPPFGYALFYMRAISPPEITTGDIILGVLPFIILIVMMCALIIVFPSLVTWLPAAIYGG